MAKKGSWNPLAFAPTQVILTSSAVYIALFTVLLWNHLTVPSAPTDPTPVKGINLTKAWLDLDVIGSRLHPQGSHANDDVRAYLIKRIEEILVDNNASFTTVEKPGKGRKDSLDSAGGSNVTVWTYDPANATFSEDWRRQPWTIYTESENVVVYIRGKQDGDWDWRLDKKYSGHGGVLVNAHFDSVSTGYGATDDGVGVVTVLQLISYFTVPGHQPEHGVVALLNNDEESGLYGAHSYLNHPMSQFVHTFLNLEGAGAGGKATLFRSTDAEVTKFYARSPSPFGSVISGDGFKQGFIRSGTDYSVFTEALGMRGLDVAFFEPRARYHTDQDAPREVSPDSVWHMLSASIETMKGLTLYNGDEFDGSLTRRDRLDLGPGSVGVWFDVFGQTFAVLKLNTLFALSVTLLVVGPVLLIVLEAVLARNDKWYIFSRKTYLRSADDDEAVRINGIRGFFRFPIAFIVATGAVVALAFLHTKINPYIVYSSPYVVWAELLSVWFAFAWFILAGGDRVRPTALQRMFVLLWLYAISWTALVAATVGENNYKLGSGYFIVIYNAGIFAALLISYLELFGLPTKHKYAEHVLGATAGENESPRPGSRSSRTLLNQSRERPSTRGPTEDDDATESTSLLQGQGSRGGGTFGKRRQQQEEALEDSDDPFLSQAFGDEQAWSSSLLQWTWIIQFLVLAPVNIILVGQIALLVVSSIHQTPADGNAVLPIYLIMAAFSILLLLPLTPFVHRFTFQIPTVLFLVFIGCLVFNLVAFPFTRDERMKYYFAQEMDLNSGSNKITLYGLEEHIQDIISDLPSAAGQPLGCTQNTASVRPGLTSCSWSGLLPRVVPEPTGLAPYKNKTKGGPELWLDYNVAVSGSSASFAVQGRNTKQCKILFDTPVSSVSVPDTVEDPRFNIVSDNGSTEVRLFSRDWDKKFLVDVTWEDAKAEGQTGSVVCLWSETEQGQIPALDELKRFEPVWAAVSKAGDGLVEGFKRFKLK